MWSVYYEYNTRDSSPPRSTRRSKKLSFLLWNRVHIFYKINAITYTRKSSRLLAQSSSQLPSVPIKKKTFQKPLKIDRSTTAQTYIPTTRNAKYRFESHPTPPRRRVIHTILVYNVRRQYSSLLTVVHYIVLYYCNIFVNRRSGAVGLSIFSYRKTPGWAGTIYTEARDT